MKCVVMYRYGKEVCDAVVAKCLTGRPKTVEKAQAIFMLWVELEAVEAFLVLHFFSSSVCFYLGIVMEVCSICTVRLNCLSSLLFCKFLAFVSEVAWSDIVISRYATTCTLVVLVAGCNGESNKE